jgi:hypothetical protein
MYIRPRQEGKRPKNLVNYINNVLLIIMINCGKKANDFINLLICINKSRPGQRERTNVLLMCC